MKKIMISVAPVAATDILINPRAIARDVYECYKNGASMVHLHCRDLNGKLTVAWICLEPAWKRRILNLIIAVLLLRIFFLSPTPEAYNKFLPYLVVYTLLTASFSWLSIVRFKAGKQD